MYLTWMCFVPFTSALAYVFILIKTFSITCGFCLFYELQSPRLCDCKFVSIALKNYLHYIYAYICMDLHQAYHAPLCPRKFRAQPEHGASLVHF